MRRRGSIAWGAFFDRSSDNCALVTTYRKTESLCHRRLEFQPCKKAFYIGSDKRLGADAMNLGLRKKRQRIDSACIERTTAQSNVA